MNARVPLTEEEARFLASMIERDERNGGRYDPHGLANWPGSAGWYVAVNDIQATPDNLRGRQLKISSAAEWETIANEPAPALHWKERSLQLARLAAEAWDKQDREAREKRQSDSRAAFVMALQALGIDEETIAGAVYEASSDEPFYDSYSVGFYAEIDGVRFSLLRHGSVGVSLHHEDCGRWVTIETVNSARSNTHLELGQALLRPIPHHECGREEGDLNYTEPAPIAPAPDVESRPTDERVADALEALVAALDRGLWIRQDRAGN